MRRSRALTGLLALAAVAPAVGPATAPTEAAYAGGRGRIVFTATPDYTDDYNLFTVNPNGSDLTQITFPTGPGDFHAQWSPDGSRIAFTRSSQTVGNEVYVIDADGSEELRITTDAGYGEVIHVGNTQPSWSADGTKLLYTKGVTTWEGQEVVDEASDLWTVNVNGTGHVPLTTNGDAGPGAWAPDGTRIAYGASTGLWVMNTNGSSKHLLVADDDEFSALDLSHIEWAPGADRIVFGRSDPEDGPGMYSVAASGGTPIRINLAALDGGFGDLAPDASRWIVAGPGRPDLYTVTVGPSPAVVRLFLTGINSETMPDWQPAPPYPFVDILSSRFISDILWVRSEGITTGCAPMRFCPTGNVTREQMASFLVRALDLPSTATDYFSDDETSSHETNINRLAAAGITTGCAVGKFCPIGNVTRAEMASFLVRALNLPSTATDYFSDDETSSHETNINRLAAAGITTGCAVGKFCPSGLVTREQMAAFLHRALE